MNEIFTSLHIEWAVVGAQAISFIALLFILKKYLYGPLEEIMKMRAGQISKSLSNADEQNKSAEELRLKYEQHLDNIAEEARIRMEQTIKDSEAERRRMLEASQIEIRELQARGQAQLELDHERLRHELRAEMSEVAVMAASKALRAQMTPQIQAAVIDQLIQELDKPATMN